MAELYAGFDPEQPCVRFALGLTVNGEKLDVHHHFPLAIWDTMSPDQKAEITLATVLGAAREAVMKFADQITVTRDDGKEASR